MNNRIINGIEKARINKGFTILELASLLKVEMSVLKAWESGAAFPPLKTLVEMKRILEVSSDMLLLSEVRNPLNISKLKEEQRKIVIDLYNKIKPM